VFPLYYGFRGGKGVATAVGAFLVLAPWPALVCIGVFVLVVATTRYVSLGSVVAMVLLPPVAGLVFHAPRPVVIAAAATAVLIVLKHRDNLKRLAGGTERKLGSR
jgi:glycerol-3-phosphate acyltransferase PlsY